MSTPDDPAAESPTERRPAQPDDATERLPADPAAPDRTRRAEPSDGTERPATWVGSAAVRPGDSTKRRPRADDTLDLPIDERLPPPPEIRYVHVPVPVYGPPPGPPRSGRRPPQPPPGYAPPRSAPPPPQYRRRRRKWPWVLLFLFALCAGCCGGAYAIARPYWDEYPATAEIDAKVAGLNPVEDKTAQKTADRLRKAVESDQVDEARFTVVYADPGNKQSRVTVFGTTRFITDPKKDLDAAMGKLTADLQLANLREVDAGALGGEQRCGTGKLDGKAVSMCAWADHGSMGVAVFAARTVEASSPILQNIRAGVIQRD
jgi:hypothetical protein